MAHQVICKYCGQKFDRDKEPYIEVGIRRYAHKNCYEQMIGGKGPPTPQQQEEQNLKELENYIMKLFNENYINVKIRKQIMDYRKIYNYTYSGILKSLQWWFDIQGKSIEDANDGIGIVPYIYKQAEEYFYMLYKAEILNEDIKNYRQTVRNIKIKSPRVEKEIKVFKLTEEDEND